MRIDDIRDEVIKPKLIDMLGNTMADDIYRKAGYATLGVTNELEIPRIFVDKACLDPRFFGMWGTAQAEKQKSEWMELLR